MRWGFSLIVGAWMTSSATCTEKQLEQDKQTNYPPPQKKKKLERGCKPSITAADFTGSVQWAALTETLPFPPTQATARVKEMGPDDVSHNILAAVSAFAPSHCPSNLSACMRHT